MQDAAQDNTRLPRHQQENALNAVDSSITLIEPQAATSVPLALRPTPTADYLLQIAVERGADLSYVEKLMDLKERHEANEARKAFSAAFGEFKAAGVKILRTKLIKDGPLKGKKHAELATILDAVTPELSAHGLSLAWKLTKDDKDWIEVTAILRHAAGHAETVSMGSPPDTGPGRNAIQARGSIKTYLERYTGTAILGLSAGDADDDGGDSSDPLEVWAGRASLAQDLDELGRVSKDGAALFKGAGNVEAYRAFAAAVQARGAALKAKAPPPVDDPFIRDMDAAEKTARHA